MNDSGELYQLREEKSCLWVDAQDVVHARFCNFTTMCFAVSPLLVSVIMPGRYRGIFWTELGFFTSLLAWATSPWSRLRWSHIDFTSSWFSSAITTVRMWFVKSFYLISLRPIMLHRSCDVQYSLSVRGGKRAETGV